MQTDYHKWWSPNLNQDMEIKVYGYYGKPLLVFPAQSGRFFDYEGFGMIDAIAHQIEAGMVKVFAVDSIDSQSWANPNAHPADKARRHEDYDRYIVEEVAPFIKGACGGSEQGMITSGCSMGAYHALNFYLRHPDVFDTTIALSGLYQLQMFVGDAMDDLVYFNTPLAYLPNMTDPWFLERYRKGNIIVCCGQGAWEEAMLADTLRLKAIFEEKGIPAWVDIWGQDVNHDWPWWRKMMPYFLDKLWLPAHGG